MGLRLKFNLVLIAVFLIGFAAAGMISRPYSGSSTRGRSNTRSNASGVPNFEPAQLEPLERALSQHIGPLARTLVRREAAKHREWAALLQALAQQIDKPEDRQRFMAAGVKLAR